MSASDDVRQLTEEEKVHELLRLFDSFRSCDSEESFACCWSARDDFKLADSRHRQQLLQLSASAGEVYSNDGHPAMFAFIGAGQNKMCGFRWAPPSALVGGQIENYQTECDSPDTFTIKWTKTYRQIDWSKVRGVIIHAHGITESARTGLLRCKATSQALGDTDHTHVAPLTEEEQKLIKEKVENEKGFCSEYELSWVDAITKAGFVLYALDHQGHGYSQGWKGERCNIDRILNLEKDLINLARSLVLSQEVPQLGPKFIPIFYTGLSFGGLLTVRALQIGLSQKLLCSAEARLEKTPVVKGLGLFCPAISGERLKKKFPNQLLLPLMKFLNTISPSARLVALQDRRPYAFLNPMIERDPMIFAGKLPIRISAESVSEMDKILPSINQIPEDLSILLIQSKNDTMTDPEGSANFMELVPCKDKKVHWLDYSWHWLAREPGYGATCQVFIDWLCARTVSP